ncbi:12214_t:CDS:2 [Rhizophagus irregularis]|nr:12214_t:CDS:2 [Rhizophagus irregularis]
MLNFKLTLKVLAWLRIGIRYVKAIYRNQTDSHQEIIDRFISQYSQIKEMIDGHKDDYVSQPISWSCRLCNLDLAKIKEDFDKIIFRLDVTNRTLSDRFQYTDTELKKDDSAKFKGTYESDKTIGSREDEEMEIDENIESRIPLLDAAKVPLEESKEEDQLIPDEDECKELNLTARKITYCKTEGFRKILWELFLDSIDKKIYEKSHIKILSKELSTLDL